MQDTLIGPETVVIGAGPAGLACAAALQAIGTSSLVLEREHETAPAWRRHYDRLHLHTPKRHSGLPGLSMPKEYSRYPSRDQVISYLKDYAAHHKIRPRLGVSVLKVVRREKWVLETSTGAIPADNVVFATGLAGHPVRPRWPGLDSFPGRVIHSSEYKNASSFSGLRVLVVGLGNSGGEIAMDLCDAGLEVTVSARSPVNIIPRDLLGIPILTWAILQKSLPYRLVDALNGPVLRLAIGNVEKFGVRRPAKGAMAQVVEDRKIPILDIGTVDRIRRGKISVRPAINQISGAAVRFEDGTVDQYDIILQATGYRPNLRSLLPDHQDVIDDTGTPVVCGATTSHPGLFFCGYIPVATGQFREIGIEANRIARAIRSRSAT
jgi:cation diffusion facilitator CzcD-associated flavoprotein CzcO